MGCFSFYANKIITTGEGGMITTNDDLLAERLRLLRNLAFGTPRFLHQEAGFNFRMTGYQAAMGRVQLRRIESTIEAKRRIAHAYTARLEEVDGIRTPVELEWARNVYWMYGIEVAESFSAHPRRAAHLARRRRRRFADVFLPAEPAAVPPASVGIQACAVSRGGEVVDERALSAIVGDALGRRDRKPWSSAFALLRPDDVNTYEGLHARYYDVVYGEKPYVA